MLFTVTKKTDCISCFLRIKAHVALGNQGTLLYSTIKYIHSSASLETSFAFQRVSLSQVSYLEVALLAAKEDPGLLEAYEEPGWPEAYEEPA